MAEFKVSRITKNSKDSGPLAYVSVTDDEIGIEFRDMKLFEGKNGHFLKFPDRAYEADGETKYAQLVSVAYDDGEWSEVGTEYVAGMLEVVLEAYESAAAAPKKKTATKSSYTKSSSTKKAAPAPARPAGRSGRGPVGKKAF